MDDLVQAVAGGAGGLAGAAVAVWIFVRHAVTKTIDQHFDHLGEIGKKHIELGYTAASTRLQEELAIYPALGRLVYRAKTATDAMRAARDPVGLLNEEFTEACRTITSQLHDWRIFLSKDLFRLLHDYKHALQDLNVIKDTVTRPDNPNVGAELPAETKKQIAELSDRIGALCSRITDELQKHMDALRGPLAS